MFVPQIFICEIFPNKEARMVSVVVKNTGKYFGLKDTENIY